MKLRIGLGDGMYEVIPQPDATGEEAMWLAVFIAVITHNHSTLADARNEFIDLHNLRRHFTKEKPCEPL